MAAAASATKEPPATNAPTKDPIEISLDKISPVGNIREVTGGELATLVDSVRQHGVIEPVLLVSMEGYTAEQRAKFDPAKRGYDYRTVAGFRRCMAAHTAGLKTVPARVLKIPEREILEVQLVENLERKELSPIQEAQAFKAYLATTSATQAELAKRIGRDPSFVSNRVRLLALPAKVLKLVDAGSLSSTHAEVLLKLPASDAEVITNTALQVVKQKASVDDLNQNVSRYVEQLEQERKFAEGLSKLKFPNCPVCKKPAIPDGAYSALLGHGTHDGRHEWDGKTGKTAAVLREEANARYHAQTERSRQSSRASAPKPKAVDCTEAATLRSAHHPMAIVQALLKQSGPEGIDLVELQHQGGSSTGMILRIGIKKEKVPIPSENGRVHVVLRPVAYAEGERSQLVVQDMDGPDRRVAKERIRAWERKALPALKLKAGKARVLDANVLKGGMGDVVPRLAKLQKDPELLELLRAAEAKAKHRAGVLDFIDGLLLANGHDRYGQDRRL